MELLFIAANILALGTSAALVIWAMSAWRRSAPPRHPAEKEVKGMIDSLTGRMDDLGERRFGRDVLSGLREQSGGRLIVDTSEPLPEIEDSGQALPRVPIAGPSRRGQLGKERQRTAKDHKYYRRQHEPDLTGRRQPGPPGSTVIRPPSTMEIDPVTGAINSSTDTEKEEERDDTGTRKQS